MKSFEYIHGIFAGYIQMFFMSFSQCYFSGFSLVWYHEKFINKAMKPLYTMNNRAKTMVKVWCWFLMFLFYDDENPMNQTAQVQGEFRRFPWHYKTLRVMKNVWFPRELGIINVHGNVLSNFMDFSLHCNDPWKSMLIRWKSFHLERREVCSPWMKIYNYCKFILRTLLVCIFKQGMHPSFELFL